MPPSDSSDSQQQRDLGPRRPPPAPAPAVGPRAGNDWLVLIAIDRYAHGGFLTPLNCCRADAEALRDLLHGKFGFSPDFTIELFDEDATEQSIRHLMEETLPEKVGPSDRVLISFSGHGWMNEKTRMGYWYAQEERIPRGHDPARTAWFAAAAGTTAPRSAGRPLGAATARRTGATASGFAWPSQSSSGSR